MSLQIIELSEAVRDVIHASDYIAAQSSLNASERFLDAVKGAYRKIADLPGIGSLRDYGQPELAGMRMWRVAKYPQYLIFYLATGSELLILRVLHAHKISTKSSVRQGSSKREWLKLPHGRCSPRFLRHGFW